MQVVVQVDMDDLASYDETMRFRLLGGEYAISVGTDSRHDELKGTVVMSQT